MPHEFFIQVAILMVVGAVFGVFFLLTDTGRNILKTILGKHQTLFTGFKNSLVKFDKDKRAVFWNLILSFVRLNVTAITQYLLILSFGGSVDYGMLMLISAVTQVLSFIPITPSGLGIKEGAFSFLAGRIGVGLPIAGAAIFSMTIINYIYCALYAYLFIQKTDFSKIGLKN